MRSGCEAHDRSRTVFLWNDISDRWFLDGGIRKQKSDGCVFFIVCGCDLWRVKSDDLLMEQIKRIQRTYLSGCPEISRTAAGDVWSV